MAFVYDAETLPAGKADLAPSTVPVDKKVTAAEYNALIAAVTDLRSALLSGQYHGLVSTPGAAVAGAGAARLRLASTRLQASIGGAAYRSLVTDLNVLDFGADPTGVADSLAAFSAAIAAAPTGGTVHVPDGTYQLSGPLNIPKSLTLEGDKPQWYGASSCVLRWPAGVDGILVLPAAQRAVVRNMCLWATGKTTAAAGLRINVTSEVSGLYVSGWATHGIVMDTTTGGGGGNANCSLIMSCAVDGAGSDGVRITGADSNACMVVLCSSRINGGWGFHDTSLTSGLYLQCHTEGNTLGPFRLANSGAGGEVVACYAESDQPAPSIAYPAVIRGGTWGSGTGGAPNASADRANETVGLRLGGGTHGPIVEVGQLMAPAGASIGTTSALLYPYIAADTTITATPWISDGITGQRLRVYNNTSHRLTLQDRNVLPGSGLYLCTPYLVLSPTDSVDLLCLGPSTFIETGRRHERLYTDTSGTPGAASVVAYQGRAAVASGAASVVVTCPFVLGSAAARTSHVVVTWEDNPGGHHWVTIPSGGGSFTVTLPAAVGADTKFRWRIED